MRGQSQQSGSKVRFGVFEADLRTGELRKLGIRIRLQSQPFKILAALLEQPGELVTREELQKRIWGDQTIGDFDHSLGTAIKKLRDALGDSADTPRYVETLAKRGFRFIQPVETIEPSVQPPPVADATVPPVEFAPPVALPTLEPSPKVALKPPGTRSRNRVLPRGLAIAGVAAIFLIGSMLLTSTPAPIPRFTKITSSDRIFPGQLHLERFPGMGTDGIRIYFPEVQNGQIVLSYASVAGGETHVLPTPPDLVRPAVADVSRDGSELLIRSVMWSETEQPLWIISSTSGAARKVLSDPAHDAIWTPDGRSILYASGNDLLITRNDGTPAKKLAELSARAYWMRYSPHGDTIRFTLMDSTTRATSLWEIGADGKNLRPLLPGWSEAPAECCGNWTAGGKFFIFQTLQGGTGNLWALDESKRWWPRSRQPFEITAGPLNNVAPVPARRGDDIFFIGANTRNNLARFDTSSQQFVSYLSAIKTAGRTELAHTKKQVAWVSTTDQTLWRGNVDGSNRLQLTSAQMRVFMMRWSPDDSRLVFVGKTSGAPWKLYTVSSDGSPPDPVLEDPRNAADPDWSPDGKQIVFGRLPEYLGEVAVQKEIHVVDLKTKSVSTLPDSKGMFCPRWSPDGRFIAAMPLDQQSLMLFDRTTEKWSRIADRAVNNPRWSRDGRSIYFHAFQEVDQPIYRLLIKDAKLERITDIRTLGAADHADFWSLGPNDALIASLRFWTADVYQLNWDPSRHSAR